MIPAVFNSMIAFLLANWLLNDLPHAAGLMSCSPMWVSSAWGKLLDFCNARGIPLQAAVEHDLAEHLITHSALDNYRTVMGGYFMIATMQASDCVVNDTYAVVKNGIEDNVKGLESVEGPIEQFVRTLRREEGVSEDREILKAPLGPGYLAATERLLWARSKMIDGTRADKVIAIDAIMWLAHEEGAYLVLVLGQGIRTGRVEEVTGEVLEALAYTKEVL